MSFPLPADPKLLKAESDLGLLFKSLEYAKDEFEIFEIEEAIKEKQFDISQLEMANWSESCYIDEFSIALKSIDSAIENAILSIIRNHPLVNKCIQKLKILGFQSIQQIKSQKSHIIEYLPNNNTETYSVILEVFENDVLWHDDYQWIMDTEYQSDFTFEQCCSRCHIDPDGIRRMIGLHVEQFSVEGMVNVLKRMRHFVKAKEELKWTEDELTFSDDTQMEYCYIPSCLESVTEE